MKTKKIRKLSKAAKMGKPHAIYQFGLYLERTGNTILAAKWISEAAELNYKPAQNWLADYYFDDNANIQANS